MRSKRRLLTIGVAIPAAIVASLILLTEERWVGSTDLELVFSVRDSQTGRPVEGATIRALPETTSGCCEEPGSEFALIADAGGEVRLRCQGCKCSGIKSLLRDTFGVAEPLWHFRVEAHGYSSTGWLHTGDFLHDVRRFGGRRSGLTIGIELAGRSPPHELSGGKARSIWHVLMRWPRHGADGPLSPGRQGGGGGTRHWLWFEGQARERDRRGMGP